MLRKRIQSGLIIGTVLLSAVRWLPSFSPVIPLILVGLAVVGAGEMYRLLQEVGWRVHRRTGMVCAALWIVVTWVAYRRLDFASASVVEGLVVVAVLAAVFIAEFSAAHHAPAASGVWGTLAGLLYVVMLLNFLTKTLLLWPVEDGRLPVLFMIVVVKCSDMAAFFIGSRWGRRKLFPRISPAKTWEGLLGGLGGALAAGCTWWALAGGQLGPMRLRAVDAVALCVLLTLVGVFGDLSESLVKRAAGCKDSASYIGGMGGLLDVIDSLLFAAPVMYAYCVFLTV